MPRPRTLRSRGARLALIALLAWPSVAVAAPGGGAAAGLPTTVPVNAHGTMTLSEAYHLALQQSGQVGAAIGARDLADVLHTGALTQMGPNLSATVTGFYQNKTPFIGAPPAVFNGGEVDVNLTQPLFRRQLFPARRATQLGTDSADQTVRRARQQLMFDVATAFIGVMRNRQQVTIAQSAVKRAETQLQNAALRVRAGGALKKEELLAQIDLNRAQIEVNAAIGGLRAADSTFVRLVGVAAPDNLVLPRTPPADAEVGLIEQSLVLRPDLRALHLSTEQAAVTVTQLQAKLFWPTLDFVFGGAYQMFPAGGTPSFLVAGVLNVPLFQSGDEWIQIRAQRARVRSAASNEYLQRLQVGDDVRQALARLQVARNAIDIANDQLKSANQYYTMISQHFKAGVATVLELVTAQAAVFEAETNKVLASFDAELATYQLLWAEGKIDL